MSEGALLMPRRCYSGTLAKTPTKHGSSVQKLQYLSAVERHWHLRTSHTNLEEQHNKHYISNYYFISGCILRHHAIHPHIGLSASFPIRYR